MLTTRQNVISIEIEFDDLLSPSVPSIVTCSLSQTPSGWRLIENRAMLLPDVGFVQTRFCALFFVDGDAAISVASMMVPPRSRAPRVSRNSAIATNIAFVNS
jgi:hypothetical protein